MAWDKQGNRRYFSTTMRCGSRRIRTYFGNGVAAKLASTLLQLRKVDRLLRKQSICEHRDSWDRFEGLLHEYYQGVDCMMRATLVSLGYYQHDRGPWRKRRRKAVETEAILPFPVEPQSMIQLAELTTKVERGDSQLLVQLRHQVSPHCRVWEQQRARGQQVQAKLQELLADHLPPPQTLEPPLEGTTPLELLLAERVSICWLLTQGLDTLLAQDPALPAWKAKDLRQRRDRADRSHTKSLRRLETVEEILLRVPQIDPVIKPI